MLKLDIIYLLVAFKKELDIISKSKSPPPHIYYLDTTQYWLL